MRYKSIFGAIALVLLLVGCESSAPDRTLSGTVTSTLGQVKARGYLRCGVTTGVAGFAFTDASGEWDGFDVSFCRAVAAAIFGDPKAVKFTPTTGKTRFTALASGKIDMLARNTTWTFSRDVDLKFTFVGVNYYTRISAGFVRGMQLTLTQQDTLHENVIILGAGSEESVERSQIQAGVESIAAASIAGLRAEAGVTFVLVSGAWGYFDHHGDEVRWGGIQKGLTPLLPTVDRVVHTLVNDLETRGLLDSTLVLMMGEPQHIAQGASLAAIVATAIVGGLTHLRRGNVDLPSVAWVAPVAIVAAFGAALLADKLDPTVLRRIFAAVFIYFALTMIVGAVRGERVSEREGR